MAAAKISAAKTAVCTMAWRGVSEQHRGGIGGEISNNNRKHQQRRIMA